jgi:hypothetical protein
MPDHPASDFDPLAVDGRLLGEVGAWRLRRCAARPEFSFCCQSSSGV